MARDSRGCAEAGSVEPLLSKPPTVLRRTRIVCLSDTHNTPVKLPKGDILIHAGDLTNQGSYPEISRAVAWLEQADFECKVVVAGNHDITLDNAFYTRHGANFHSQIPQSADDCRSLLKRSPTITYLCHGSTSVRLKSAQGPHTRCTVFGSPYSPRDGNWAFSYERAGSAVSPSASFPCPSPSSSQPSSCSRSSSSLPSNAAIDTWSAIPADADIVITHTPPFQHCDWSAARGQALGCEELYRVLRRVRPRLAICGHVHEGRGAERVQWDDTWDELQDLAGKADGQVSVERWKDPGSCVHNNAKLSLVDLTPRRGGRALDNDGSVEETAMGIYAGSGRRETCIVNCAIAATNHPHAGGKKFNKPIVVDLELPVWEDN